MGSVAASAATAVATAQSVAADRLRHEIQASEEARARWARELHDETLQGLVGLRMLLASARRSDSAEYVGRGRLGRARADAARDPEPPQPDRRAAAGGARRARARRRDRDAVGAQRRGRRASRWRRRSSCGTEATARLARDTETTVYRLVQEALSNAARHSGGSVVRVEVAEREDADRRGVADNGHGFDPAATTGGFGLRGMRERVELAGGWMTIDSSRTDDGRGSEPAPRNARVQACAECASAYCSRAGRRASRRPHHGSVERARGPRCEARHGRSGPEPCDEARAHPVRDPRLEHDGRAQARQSA